MGSDPERTPAEQADALAALLAPEVAGMTPSKAPAPPEPAPEEPVAQEPAAEDPALQEPAPQEPVAEELVAEEPLVEQPLAEQPLAEEPLAQEPVAQEPVPAESRPVPAARPRVAGGRPPPPRGEGELFQPVPEANLVDRWRPGPDGAPRNASGIDIVAPEGTPVHAVAGGTVAAVEDAGRAVRVQGEDGRRYAYRLLEQGSVTVAPGQRIEAGRILGAVGPGPPLPHLHLEVGDADGTPLNPYELLLGVPDPNELGYGAVGLGVDIDPDLTDRETIDPEPTGREAATTEPDRSGPSGSAAPDPPAPEAEQPGSPQPPPPPEAEQPGPPQPPPGPSPEELGSLVADLIAPGAPGTEAGPERRDRP